MIEAIQTLIDAIEAGLLDFIDGTYDLIGWPGVVVIQLGVDANTTTLIDPNGRPQYLVENRELIRELI